MGTVVCRFAGCDGGATSPADAGAPAGGVLAWTPLPLVAVHYPVRGLDEAAATAGGRATSSTCSPHLGGEGEHPWFEGRRCHGRERAARPKRGYPTTCTAVAQWSRPSDPSVVAQPRADRCCLGVRSYWTSLGNRRSYCYLVLLLALQPHVCIFLLVAAVLFFCYNKHDSFP